MTIQEVKYRKLKLKDIPSLRFGVVHSQMGFDDGVSIVIRQIEDALVDGRNVPRDNFYYLVGKSKSKGKRIKANKTLWHKHPLNKKILRNFSKGLSDELKEEIEISINKAKVLVRDFIAKNKIDILIVHNSSHPVNFIMALGVSRYYSEAEKNNLETPKYILWWHDSHLERSRFKNPAADVKDYLLEGVPGRHVEYIIFINSNQFSLAEKYFFELDKVSPGYYDEILRRYCVIYNTTRLFIGSSADVENRRNGRGIRIREFLKRYGVNDFLKKSNLKLEDVAFVLQHTRIVERKRIGFAVEYCYILQEKLKRKGLKKSVVLFISGHSGDEPGNYKRRVINLKKAYDRKLHDSNVHLVFAEDYENNFKFEEFPLIFSQLNGISTYFSEVEGFGNNLLEVLAAGLIPVVNTYDVFVTDIQDKKFRLVPINDFQITEKSLNQVLRLVRDTAMRKKWIDRNLKILEKNFSSRIISRGLGRAVIRERIKN